MTVVIWKTEIKLAESSKNQKSKHRKTRNSFLVQITEEKKSLKF